jgi:Rieske Fe-S protein
MSQKSADESRRKFLDLILGGALIGSIASFAYPLMRYLIPPKMPEANPTAVKVAPESAVSPNSAVMFKYGRKPGILIRNQDGKLSAFSAVCTHLDCTVQFRPDLGIIWCACHNGRYDLTGRVISGPPPRPLTPFEVNIKDGDIYVSQKEM